MWGLHTQLHSYVHASSSGSEVYHWTYLQTSVECYIQPILVHNYSRVIEPHQTIQSTQPYIKRKVGGTISWYSYSIPISCAFFQYHCQRNATLAYSPTRNDCSTPTKNTNSWHNFYLLPANTHYRFNTAHYIVFHVQDSPHLGCSWPTNYCNWHDTTNLCLTGYH